jgi:hypothetical protein
MPMPMVKNSSVAVNAVNVIDFTKGFYWVFVIQFHSHFKPLQVKPLPHDHLSLMARGLLRTPEESDISREKTILMMSVVLKSKKCWMYCVIFVKKTSAPYIPSFVSLF